MACYGSSPLLARQAFLNAPGVSTVAGGCLAYGAAMLVFSLALLKPGSWQDIKRMKRENMPWFLAAAVLVAVSQALVYASLAVAPLMVVTPILQLSLVFRLFLSQLINRDYEVMNIGRQVYIWRAYGRARFDAGFDYDQRACDSAGSAAVDGGNPGLSLGWQLAAVIRCPKTRTASRPRSGSPCRPARPGPDRKSGHPCSARR